MAKFHLMHCVPPGIQGPRGFLEIIESVRWGLEQLGHEVTYALNGFQSSSTNIVFGAHLLPLDALRQLPEHTIVYNFEQGRGLEKGEVRPEAHFMAANFRVWDYSSANIEMWRSLGSDMPKVVPVGYAPILSRIGKPQDQDIDVFIYGTAGDKRLKAFYQLSHEGYTVLFASGMFGAARDALIGRSKVVLNVNFMDRARIFEVVRVSYLLANRKAVVAVLDPGTSIEPDLMDCVKSATAEQVVAACRQLLSDDTQRNQLEELGYEIFRKRDVTGILALAIS